MQTARIYRRTEHADSQNIQTDRIHRHGGQDTPTALAQGCRGGGCTGAPPPGACSARATWRAQAVGSGGAMTSCHCVTIRVTVRVTPKHDTMLAVGTPGCASSVRASLGGRGRPAAARAVLLLARFVPVRGCARAHVCEPPRRGRG